MKVSTQELKNTPPQELRKFGFIMAIFLGGIFGVALPLYFGNPINLILVGIALGFVLFALVLPKILIALYIPWMILGAFLGNINSKIILGIIYYLIFTLVAFIMRIIKRDPLNRSLDPNAQSYKKVVAVTDPKHMENPF